MVRSVYGRDWVIVGDDIRVKIDHDVYDTLAVRVTYRRGGNGTVRGYYLSVVPVGDRCMVGSDGMKILLNAVARRSDKRDAAAVISATGIMPMVISDVCAKIGATMRGMVIA